MSQQTTKRQALSQLFSTLEMVFQKYGLLRLEETKELKQLQNLGLEEQASAVQRWFLRPYQDGKLADFVRSEAGIWVQLALKMRAPSPQLQELQRRLVAKKELCQDPAFLGEITAVLEKICRVIAY